MRSTIPRDVPDEVRRDLKKRRIRSQQNLVKHLLGRVQQITVWSIFGGAVAYGLCYLLSNDESLLMKFAAGGAVATAFIKFKRLGRFAGLFFYGIPLTVASYSCYQYDVLDADEVNITLLYCVWGAALLTGALIGLSEEVQNNDR